MRHLSALIALLALPALLLVTACGGSEQAAATSTTSSASLAPRDAAVWASLDTDPESAQWQELTVLLERVPGARAALDELLADALEGEGLDWEEDVLQALGPEVVLVVPAGSGAPVVLTQPEDEERLRALADRDEDTVLGERDGWTVVAESQAALDGYEQAMEEGTLADDPDFEGALSGLPEEALAHLYLDGAGLGGALARGAAQAGAAIPGGATVTGPLTGSTGALGTVAAAVTAEADGLRLVGTAEPESGAPESFTPTLLERVPADALAVVSFRGGDAVEEQLGEAAGGAALGEQLEQALGFSFDELAELLSGEGVLYVREGGSSPELTLALDGAGDRGVTLIGDLVDGLGALFSFGGSAPALRPQTATEDGIRVTSLRLGDELELRWAAVGDTLVVTTGPGAIRSFAGDGPKLTATAAFARAAEDVGFEGETSGFAYADVDALVPVLESLSELPGSGSAADPDPEVAAALEALDSLALDARAEGGGRLRVEGFLRVR